MASYYNEIDPFAAAWLRELIKAGLIAPGEVDERDIRDVRPDDLRGFVQCHFFAGIGVWSYALRNAGWSDDRPVWTGSCPCQPFSAAGKRGGTADERHLWPHWHHLIRECRPAIVFGEQVASKDGLGWLDLVHADLEGTGYAVGAADLCAAGVGAPHIRQRLWFVGEALDDAAGARHVAARQRAEGEARDETWLCGSERGCGARELADADRERRSWQHSLLRTEEGGREPSPLQQAAGRCGTGELADTNGRETCAERQQPCGEQRQQPEDCGAVLVADTDDARPSVGSGPADGRGTLREQGAPSAARGLRDGAKPGPTNGFWRAADWLYCRDDKWRPVEPGTFPLAHGAPARVGRLRGYGNAIVAEAARTFIEAYLDARHRHREAASRSDERVGR